MLPDVAEPGGGAEKVAVVVRARPPRADGGRPCLSGEGECTVLTHESTGKTLSFTYDRAFFWDTAGRATTRDVYEAVGRRLLAQTLSGYHTSLLAYGQTGAGLAPAAGARVLGRLVDSQRRQWQDAHALRHRRGGGAGARPGGGAVSAAAGVAAQLQLARGRLRD